MLENINLSYIAQNQPSMTTLKYFVYRWHNIASIALNITIFKHNVCVKYVSDEYAY